MKFEVMSNAEYRQREGLSSSDIKRMMKSFATWKYFKDNPQENIDTPSLKFGRCYHKYMLEPYDFMNEYVVAPKVDRRTKEGKEEYAKFLVEAGDKEVIDEETFDKLQKMQEVLYATPYVKKLINGEHEKSFFWTDEKYQLPMKIRPDSYGVFGSQKIITDLKTAKCAETSAFMRDALKYNYDIQAVHYIEGMKAITGDEYKFVFVVQEVEQPYLVNVLEADEYFLRNGYEVRDEMLKTYKRCIELNEYPGYLGFTEDKNFINLLSVPNWIRQAMDSESEDIEDEIS